MPRSSIAIGRLAAGPHAADGGQPDLTPTSSILESPTW